LMIRNTDPSYTPIIIGSLYSGIASYSAYAIFLIFSECYTDRLSGNMVRIRTLPNGVRQWMIGKLIFCEILFLDITILALLAATIFIPQVQFSVSLSVGILAVVGFGILVMTPYGFMVGVLIRSVFGFLVVMAVTGVLFIFTSGFVPFDALPEFTSYMSVISPFFWLGYAGYTLQASAGVGPFGVFNGMSPIVVFGVLALWGVVGWAIAPKVVQIMMRKETIGRLSQHRQKTRELSGL
ncbi:ABC transporter permease, partial [Stomatohabitans albus]